MTTLQILQGIKTWVTTKLNLKQDVINDLANIRSGAQAGSTAVQPAELSAYFNDASYDNNTHRINFYHGQTVVAYVDASPFIIDGMVDDVRIENGYLVIDFNTASGKQDISIPLTDIFNPNNYYNKTQTDGLLAQKQDVIQDLADIRSGASAGSTAVQPSTLNNAVKNVVAESGVYDVSANNDNTKFESLSALLSSANLNTLIPTDIRKGGMSIKFIQLTPATYSVVKTEGLTEQPTGTEVQEALAITDGTYTAAQLPVEAPATTATYWLSVTETVEDVETTIYTSWVITKVTADKTEYVQKRYMSSSTAVADFTNVANWQGVDSEPTAGSRNLVESGGVLNSEALLMSSVFVKPAVTGHSRIVKNTGKKQSLPAITTYTTGWIAISENSDVFVLGTTDSVSTAVALYSSNSENSFITAEQNERFVHYTAKELLSLGAQYIRCTITKEQFNTGNWFVIASNIEKSVDDIITNIITDIFSPDIKIDTARGCFTIDILYLQKLDGSIDTIYANGDSSEHSPVTYTLNNGNLVCVLSKNKTIEIRNNMGGVLASDIILLIYASAKYFYGGALYKYVANSVKNGYRNDVKTEELLSGGSLNRVGRQLSNSNYRTDYLEIKEGCGIAVKAYGSSSTSIGVICFYSDANINSFITSFYNGDEFTISYNELVAIGAKYFRCSISAEQVENGNWYIQYLSVREINDGVKNAVSFLPQELTFTQKVQVRENIDAISEVDISDEREIDLSVYPLSRWSINANNLWVSNTGSAQVTRTKFIPIEPGKVYTVKTVIASIVAILKDNEDLVKATTPHFSDEFIGRIPVEANGSFTFVCPSDAHICYLLQVSSDGQTETTISETQTIQDLYKRVSDVEDKIKDIDVEIDDANIVNLRRLAEIKGNSLTPLSIPVDEDGYEIPTTREVLNVQKKAKQMTDIVWTPLADIPYHGAGGVFPANVPVTGLPYSSVKEIDKYIGFDVSIHTFMTALNNPYSLLYTECVLGTRSASAWGKTYHGVDNVACYMGTVCSVLSGYGTGQVVQWSTAEDRWCAERNLNMIKVFNQSAQGLHIGDIIWISGHNRLVVGLKRDSDGNVTHVQITESTGSHVRQNNDITAIAFDNNLATERGGGIIYRNTELYKNIYTPSEFVAVGDETITPYVYNDDICTFAGNKACFRENDLIVINYDLKNSGTAWTAIEVYKDDVLLETYNIADIDQSELPEGQRNHAIKLGSEHTYGMYKARLTDGTNYSDYSYWEVIQTDVTFVKNDNIHHIEWGSENGVPLSFTICNINGTVYAHNELAIEDVRNGYIDLDLVKFNKQQYPSKPFTTNMYLKIHFEGQYGRVTNEPLAIEL